MGKMLGEILLLEFEESLKVLYEKLNKSKGKDKIEYQKNIDTKLKKIYSNLTNWQKTLVARHPSRPHTKDYIENIFEKITYISGDRLGSDDESMIGALAFLNEQSVVIVGQQKGRSLEENIRYNFGMVNPEGYRKALRLFKMADTFNKPIVTFIDTPGAYPGLEAEEKLQAEAIAMNLREMGNIKVPIISIIIGEGGSGGALGIGVSNHILMLKNSIYSVISPEACASILWKDASKKELAAKLLKNDAETSKGFGVIDEIIDEGIGGAHRNWEICFKNVKNSLIKNLKEYGKLRSEAIIEHRMQKFTNMGHHINK